MAEQQSSQDKTEKATPRRRRKAREKGQVAKSQEVSSVAVMLAGLLTLFFTSTYLYNGLSGVMRTVIGQAGTTTVDMNTIHTYAYRALEQFFWLVMPILLMVFIVAILANVVQVGFLFSVQLIKPKPSKLNPINGLKRIMSKRSLVEMFKSVGKVVIVGYVAYSTIRGQMDNMLGLGDQTVIEILAFIAEVSFLVFIKSATIMVILAILDFAFNKWDHEKNLKMSKREVKDEWKQTEGDPLVRQRIRQTQHKLAQSRMMSAVPEADVVVTNPRHYAVALKYDTESMEAPTVTAKGADRIAAKIRELAEKHDVPMVENPPLARSLYQVEVGDFIPVELFEAVAKVLAYVYRLHNKHHPFMEREETA